MPLNEKQITELSEKYGMHKWQIEDMIKISDFTDDKAFSKEKQLTKKKILASLVEAVTVFRSTNDAKVKDRARKLYVELQEFITASDFTDDAKNSTYHKLTSLMTQLKRILDNDSLIDEMLVKLSESERTVLYNHPLMRDYNIDLLP